MPTIPKQKRRPWEPKRAKSNEPGQGRKVINTFYQSKSWRALRNKFMSGESTHLGTSEPWSNKLCIECFREQKTNEIGKTVHIQLATTADHIQPINPRNSYDTQNGKYGEPLLWVNLQPLCSKHHAIKSAKEGKLNKF
jgi:hypothetical protein